MRLQLLTIITILMCFISNAFAIKIEKTTSTPVETKSVKPSADNPEVIKICNKYGVNRKSHTIYDEKNDFYRMSDGKKFKYKDTKYFNVIEGESITFPLNNNLIITLDKFTVDFKPNGDHLASVAKFTVNDNGKTSKLTSLFSNGVNFPAKIGGCYFQISTYSILESLGDKMAVGLLGYCN